MKIQKILLIILVLYLISMFGIIYTGYEREKVEVLCVDGNENINLEGFMCEGVKETWFGIDANWCILFLIPFALIGLLLVVPDWGDN